MQTYIEIARNLKVVNDTAEGAVKLMEEFNQVLSRYEKEKQIIKRTVADYRKKLPQFEQIYRKELKF